MPVTKDDNAVLFWNDVFLKAALADSKKTPPPPPGGRALPAETPVQEQGGPTRTSRAGAIIHLAVHNAVNAVRHLNKLYEYIDSMTGQLADPGNPPAGATLEGVATGAAHKALTLLYPAQAQAGTFNQALTEYQALGLAGSNHAASIAFGNAVAELLFNSRKNDGSVNPGTYVPPAPGPLGQWFEDPNLAPPGPALDPHWGSVRPFVLPFGSILRPTPFPPITPDPLAIIDDYSFAHRLVYLQGSDPNPPATPPALPTPPSGFQPQRLPDEEEIAIFWSYDDGLGTPIRLYNQHALQILNQETDPPTDGSPIHRHARLFALINIAMADAGIACWEAKYFYNVWRPYQGIRVNDNNPNTTDNVNWLPLGRPRATNAAGERVRNTTPNFPAYTSGHSAFGTAMFGMLRKFFVTPEGEPKEFDFSLVSDEHPPDPSADRVPRVYDGKIPGDTTINRYQQAITENSESRLFLGVHWRRDATVGVPLGQQVADYVWPTVLTVVPTE